ncbi:MAG: ABC transporter substrate-binding protein [Candidatus Binatia bacterium]
MTRIVRCAAAALFALSLTWAAAVAADASPIAIIDELHGTLLGVMKDAQALGYAGRYERIRPVIDRHFDLDFMARFVLGPGWKELSPADQERWREAFEHISAATYAGRFTGYGGERFRTLGEEPGAEGTVFVRTVLDRPDGEDVELTYRLRSTDGAWKIVDVYQKGTVSELALRRSEYSTVLKREGFAKLLASVHAKAADYAAGKVNG